MALLGASGPLEEVATTRARLLPLRLSARQVQALIQPVGAALAAREDAQVAALWVEAAQARTAQAPEEPVGEPIARLSVELDGIMARRRRGSVPLADQEAERRGGRLPRSASGRGVGRHPRA